jgi:diguanylate cyclase (GGDEF)-like protein/PAS domain S-box-containing protein
VDDLVEHYFNDKVITKGEVKLFRTLWNTSSDNMFIVRREVSGEYINEKSNPSLERTFNVTQGQVDEVSLKVLLDDDMYNKVASYYDECIDRNTPITYEEKHMLDDSGYRYWITTILPVVCKENGVTRIFGISKETTKIHDAKRALQRYNETLEKKVMERTAELNKALKDMEELAVTDKLTKLYNRHRIDEALDIEITKSERYGTHFGVLILDIDNFKMVNDNYGHYAGDVVLKEFADILSRYVRESDTLGRWGGEEFVIIVPDSNKDSILHFAQRLREIIQEYKFDVVGNITASIGTTLYINNDTPESLISRADSALYQSKNSGRNCVNFM